MVYDAGHIILISPATDQTVITGGSIEAFLGVFTLIEQNFAVQLDDAPGHVTVSNRWRLMAGMMFETGLFDGFKHIALLFFFIVGDALGMPKIDWEQSRIGIAHRRQYRRCQQLRRKRHETPMAFRQRFGLQHR
ncbi:hypothetical protein [Methylomonas sp. UP202]|uniref:hypothetical protein n=1 Tax=Methylomonas sp. UP202 TaxID=3040943 RepID=UPI002478650B|nr:hypothetical protein [Methylomonas sp. UP202]WGS88594.1 hypothetical protein QC632_24935 [Methylomonas sp. UP202]